ncbi:hypothetical protein BCA37_20815 [Mycobacterium sp. djl-10]|nr:hypothetical protein BCA37_20815 [Mycobacterium sp. djl-10]
MAGIEPSRSTRTRYSAGSGRGARPQLRSGRRAVQFHKSAVIHRATVAGRNLSYRGFSVPFMSRNRARRRNKRAQRDAARKHRAAHSEAQTPTLTELLRGLLSDQHPLNLLAMVSFALGRAMPDPFAEFRGDHREVLDLARLVDNVTEDESPVTSAFLAALAELTDDEEIRARCRQTLADRGHELPFWLSKLADLDIYRAVHRTHVLGDRSELLIGARLMDRTKFTCIVQFEHGPSLRISDAGFSPESISSLITAVNQQAEHPDFIHVEMDPAEARAWIDEGFGPPATMFLPHSTAWPESKALLQWLLRKLPDGGMRIEPPRWSSEDIHTVLRDFVTTLPGRASSRFHLMCVLAELCESTGTGDPLRWSESRLQEILTPEPDGYRDFEDDLLVDLPELLRQLVPFAHAQAGIRQGLTDRALAAISEYEPAYYRTLDEAG